MHPLGAGQDKLRRQPGNLFSVYDWPCWSRPLHVHGNLFVAEFNYCLRRCHPIRSVGTEP